MNRKSVIGIGEFLFDVLPGGKKAGGAPVNFAYHAMKHGVDACAISALGDDELGRELSHIAKEYGIKVIAPTVPWPTSTVRVTVDEAGIPTFTICEDVAWDHIPLTSEMLSLASGADAVCFGSLSQRCRDSRKTIHEFLNAVKPGALKVYDINLRQHYYSKELVEDGLMIADVLKLNDDEFVTVCELFNLPKSDEAEACGTLVREYSLKNLILTAGSERSTVYSCDGSVSTIATPKVEVVDTVGAGDSFTGAFIASVLNGKTIAEAHHSAVEAAAEVCTKAGAWV